MRRIKFPFWVWDRFLLVQSLEPFAVWLGMIQQDIVEPRYWSNIAFQRLTLSAHKEISVIPLAYRSRLK